LSFGDKMPRGYIQELGSGSSKIRNNKEVWTGDEPEICLYKCSCGRYMHYLWCLHVMLRAIDVKLVMAPYCPATMDSSKIQHVRGVKAHEGRPAKARPGEALSKG